jgi:hypothetical protein
MDYNCLFDSVSVCVCVCVCLCVIERKREKAHLKVRLKRVWFSNENAEFRISNFLVSIFYFYFYFYLKSIQLERVVTINENFLRLFKKKEKRKSSVNWRLSLPHPYHKNKPNICRNKKKNLQ